MAWVLSLGAGRGQIPLLRAIRHEGHKVVGVDVRNDAEAVDLCDVFRPISNRDVDAVSKFAEWAGVQAVMVAASEVADVGAIVAHRLGLPGISVATAVACKDKLWQKKVLQAAGVPCTIPFEAYDGASKALFDRLGHHVVVKPRVGSGSRGVSYVDNPMELPVALRDAWTFSPDALIEKYEPGPQLSVESLVWQGETIATCVVDRWYPPGRPVFKEVGGSWPSEHDTPAVHRLMASATRALGITNGTLKADVVVTTDGPKIIECTPRLSGGPMASIIFDGSGVDYLRCAVRIATGTPPRLPPFERRTGNPIARLMDGSNVPFEEREKYIVRA